MSQIKYVIRFFKDDMYHYSIHCSPEVLDDLLAKAKEDGLNVKVLAYKSDFEEDE